MGNNKLSIGVALPSHSPAKRLLRHGSRSTSPSSDSEHQAKRIKVTSMISMAARAMSNESRRHVYALSNGVARSINETQALVQQDSIDASSLFSLQLFSEVDKIDGKLGQYSGIEGGQVKENLADVFSAHKIIDVDDEEKEYAFEEFPNINKEDASESAPHLSKNWSDEEHQLLLTFFKAGKPWKKITEKIPGRTKRSCKQEWYNKFTKRNPSLLKDFQWSDEEDTALVFLHSAGNTWEEISEQLLRRPAEVCKQRWKELRTRNPSLQTVDILLSAINVGERDSRKAPWSQQEENSMITLRKVGKSWKEISEQSIGRTPKSCLGTYYRIIGDYDCSPDDVAKNISRKAYEASRSDVSWSERKYELFVSLCIENKSWQETSDRTNDGTVNEYRSGWYTNLGENRLNAAVGRKAWSEQEEELIAPLHIQNRSWDEISQQLPKLTVKRYEMGWYGKLAMEYPNVINTRQKRWSNKENDLLVSLNREEKTWQEISERLPGRTAKDCKNVLQRRLRQLDSSPSFNARPRWTAQEEHILDSGYRAGQTSEEVSEQLVNRSPRTCLSRWTEKLKPLSVSIDWAQREDDLLMKLHKKGKGWEYISAQLPLRTADACALRWTHRSRRITAYGLEAKDDPLLNFPVSDGLTCVEAAAHLPNSTMTDCKVRYEGPQKSHEPKVSRPEGDHTLLTSMSESVQSREEISNHSRSQQTPRDEYPWNTSEDRVLHALHERIHPLSWERIAQEFSDRSADVCETRWREISASFWTTAEDSELRDLREADNDWDEIANQMSPCRVPRWNGNDCQTRYCALTEAGLVLGPAEQKLLLSLYNQKSWKEISKSMPPHSAEDCRNYWYAHYWKGKKHLLNPLRIHYKKSR